MGDDMQKFLVLLMLTWSGVACAQQTPPAFKQDTPPAPGQVVAPQHERLRLAPLPLRVDRSEELGLPSTGPKGLLRESYNEPKYYLPVDR
jgi:hypothetical protein